MKLLCASRLLFACLAVVFVSEINPLSAKAQVYYYYGTPVVAPAYPLPAPNYVVYSPSFIGWRSAGYYGGNWGPYYYQPVMVAPYVSGTMIWPNTIPAYPPAVWYASPW